jgi:glycosyltransferase involved in cell wall biosynthesis
MERYALDVVGQLLAQGVPVHLVCQRARLPVTWREGVTVKVLRKFTPLNRLNALLFEWLAPRHLVKGWPVLSISRVAVADQIAITGGTHKGHLRRKGGKKWGLFARMTVSNEQRQFDSARTVVAHAAAIAEEVRQDYHIPENRIRTLYPPVDMQRFSLAARAQRQALRARLGIRDDQFLLLFPSNDHERKGASLILQALKAFSGKVILAVASRHPLQAEGVLNLGFRQDMPELYGAADASILASRYEPFGLVGPESVLCGTPCLLARTVGATEVLAEPGCWAFDLNVASLTAQLQALVTRFDAGGTDLPEPLSCFRYDPGLARHVQDLLALVQDRFAGACAVPKESN